MAIDVNALRNKLKQLQNQGSKQLWKPSPGENNVRIVPYKHNKENPFIELQFHYDFGKKTYLSPATSGKPDPIVEFSDKLKASGDTEDWKLGKKMEPKMRTYVPILVRGKENEGVKFWGFGKQVYTELLGFIADPDYGDITDLVDGRDIVVTFTPAAGEGAFPKTQIRVKPNVLKATTDSDIVAKIKEQVDINELFPEATYDELKIALETWLSGDTKVADTPETPFLAGTDDKPTKTSAVTVDDASAAFDALFTDK